MPSRIRRFVTFVGHARARHILMACGVGVGVVLAIGALMLLADLRNEYLADSERELKNLAFVLAEETDRGLQTAELAELGVVEYMQQRGIDSPDKLVALATSSTFHDLLRSRIAGLPMVDAMAVIDASGRILNSSRSWPVRLPDVADRDFFQAFSRDTSLGSFISQPTLNRANGTWSVMFARGFTAPDGRLLGIVSSSIQLAYYEQIYSQISLEGSGSFALYRRDGMLLARYPHADANIGRNYSDDDSFTGLLAATDHSSMRRISVLDGKYRVIAPRSVAHYPLIVSVTNTVQAILSPWHGKAETSGIATLVIELALTGLVVLGVRHLRGYEALETSERARTRAEGELAVAEEHDRAAQALRAQEHRFNTALHNMLQGLLMISHSGQLLVVNNRFYELFGMPSGSLTPGISYLEMTDLVVEFGNVSAEDMRGVRDRRAELIARNERAVATWELSDGRAFNVTHQPMEEGWLTTFEDVTSRRRAETMMVHLAHHDALTDLPNRVLFRTKLEEAMAFARRGHNLALLCLDLDQFKTVNDTLGHPLGDALLQAVAQRLTGATREIDTVARLGGDEFSIVQTAIERPAEATGFANRLLELMSAPFEIAGHQIVIGTSIGIAWAPQDGLDADQLLRCADMALYRAKQDGRGVYRMFQAEMDAEMQARRLLELDLRQALPTGQLEVFYQPQVDLRVGAMTGVEALLRWRHPQRGMVSPAQFIPLAEEIGLIVPIGEWVLREACRTVASWPGDVRVAVNLSAVQFKSRNLVAVVEQALHDAALPPDRLELEITETVMLNDTDTTVATLNQLRNLGVRIAMDDFGTGYSSLSYLRRFPFDRIKIDQTFVRDMSSKSDCSAIVRAVASLGRELGMATTAEGVETQEQLDLLVSAGCCEIQGYLFSPAVAGDAVAGIRVSIADMLRQSVGSPMAEAAQ